MPPASFRNVRRMLASSTSSTVFHSPARRPVVGRGMGDAIRRGTGAVQAGLLRARAGAARWIRRRQRHTQLSAARPSHPFFGCLRALAIKRHTVRGKIPFVQRHEDALEAAIGRLLGAQHHARLAARRASKRGEHSDVLIGLVREQPAAASGCGCADDLAVFGAPCALADRLPSARLEPVKTASGAKFFDAP